MAKLSYFNRHAKLTIKFKKQDNLIISFRTVVYEHYIPLNDTKVYNNVRIAFDIQKYPSKGLDCNGTAKIMIYNIADDINDKQVLCNRWNLSHIGCKVTKKLLLSLFCGQKMLQNAHFFYIFKDFFNFFPFFLAFLKIMS